MKGKIIWILFAVVLCINVTSCNKDDDDSKQNRVNATVYCWDFQSQGITMFTLCDLTEADVNLILDAYKNVSIKRNETSSTCWDYLLKGSVFYSQCGLTEAEAYMVLEQLRYITVERR